MIANAEQDPDDLDSELAACLPLFAQLRRFTLAVLAAAETAADPAAVIRTGANAEQDADDLDSMDAIPIERRMMLTLPKAWDISQIKAEQPATTYEMFEREILNEIARSLNVPYNIAAGNSSNYNYSSGRLDHQMYLQKLQGRQR